MKEVMDFVEFAHLIGEGDAWYVAALAKADRLVLTPEGNGVYAQASLDKLRNSTEPSIEPFRTVRFGEFAKILGVEASWVTQLKKDDRLVLTDDGKRVLVQPSIKRIRETEDPAHQAVAARHAAQRGHGVGDGPDAATIAAPAPAVAADAAGGAEPEDDGGKKSSEFQYWRERGERAKALSLERENAAAEGKLLDRERTLQAIESACTKFRIRMENLAPTVGPQLTGMADEDAIVAILAEAVNEALTDLERQLAKVAKEAA